MAFRQEPDFIQEEHAAVRGLEESLSRLPCLAVRATHEPEELGFAKRLRRWPRNSSRRRARPPVDWPDEGYARATPCRFRSRLG